MGKVSVSSLLVVILNVAWPPSGTSLRRHGTVGLALMFAAPLFVRTGTRLDEDPSLKI